MEDSKDCSYGKRCEEFDCPYDHPPSRKKPCRYGSACYRKDCYYLHPNKNEKFVTDIEKQPENDENDDEEDKCEDLCKFGKKCQIFECLLQHPPERKELCNQNCRKMTCNKLHPKSRSEVCKDRENCSNYFCTKLHPKERKLCKFGLNCAKENCEHIHPPRSVRCKNNMNCIDYECKFTHPPGRLTLCKMSCTNSFCEYLHPNDWNPLANEEKLAIDKNLRTQKERDEYRLKNKLPIYDSKEIFISRLKSEKVLVVTAATGSGKTTQLPQYLAESFPGLIVCTQPRVLAAITIAQRIASEYDNASVGENVGYKVAGGQGIQGRRILLMTDGALIRKAQNDPNLNEISVLLIDEAHERSLNTDLVLGIAKLVRQQRNNFYVVIASATIDPKGFLEFFFGSNSIQKSLDVKGRVFEIVDEEKPIEFTGSYDFLVPTVNEILKNNPDGNCLVFLPGAREIDEAVQNFKLRAENNWVCFPLYGSLPPEEQSLVMTFDDQNETIRMVVFCTNVAETSLTVPNIRIVIDTGLAKEARFDPIRRLTILEQVYISKSSSMQRRGRAGRTAEGLCVRLYSSNSIERESIEPEIMRASLDLVVLQLKILNYDPLTFPFISKPKEESIANSIELLKELGCLDDSPKNQITTRGRQFAELPYDPRMSNFVMMAHEKFDEGENCAIIASILTAPGSVFFFGVGEGKKNSKEKIMEIAAKYESDIELLKDIYLKWFDSGKMIGNFCEQYEKQFLPHLVKKNQGCRFCRVKFASENKLNNKIMETILNSKDQVLTIIKKTPNNVKRDQNIRLTEVIGRCLIASFREQMGEMLLPENPDAGIHLLDNGGKGTFSSTSTFAQKQQKSYSEVIAMKITQIPNGYLILDQVHPISSEWIPEKYLQKLCSLKKDIKECLVFPNLNVKYRYTLSKELRALEKTYKWVTFTVVTYDNLNTTLRVYGPNLEKENIRQVCYDIIAKQKKQDLEYETMIEISKRTANAYFISGMILLKVENGNLSRIRFAYNPINIPTKSKDDFVKWICKNAKINEKDIKWCNTFKKLEDDKSYADIGFCNKEAAKIVRDSVTDAFEIVNSKDEKSSSVLLKMSGIVLSVENLEESLENEKYKPIRIEDKIFNHTFPIFINMLPPNCQSAQDIKKVLPWDSFQSVKEPIFKKNKFGENYVILNFSNYDDRNHALNYIKSSKFATKSFKVKGKNRSPKIEAKDGENNLRSEFLLTFCSIEKAEAFYHTNSFDKLNCKCEGYVTLRIENASLFPIEDYLETLQKNFDVRNEFKKHKNGTDAYVTLIGPSPQIVSKAANQLISSIAPLNTRFTTKQQQMLIREIYDLGLLDEWDNQYNVIYELFDDKKTGEFYKLEIFGDQISQGNFMAEIMNYSDSFNARYKSIPLPTDMNFLFKRERIGANFLQNLNKQLDEKASLIFVNFENAIEIYVKSKTQTYLMTELTNKIEEFINDSSAPCFHDPDVAKNFNSCVFCFKQASQTFSICGHHYCFNCLVSKTKSNCSAGQTLECEKCQTPVSVRDIKACLAGDELSNIAQIVASFYCKNDPTSEYSLCPLDSCGALREKKLGYSLCVCCGTISCAICGAVNQNHEGRSCKEYDKIMKYENFIVRSWLEK